MQRPLFLTLALLLAACQTPTPVKPAATRSAAPSQPEAVATTAAPVAVPTATATRAPFKPSLPKALAVVLPGAFNGVISDHGVALVSNNGSGLVANNGGGLVGNNAGAFRLAATGYGVGDFAATLLGPYRDSRKLMVELLALAEANQEDLFAGKTVPLLVNADGKGSFMAMKLLEDHAELTAWDDDGRGRVPFLWVTYTDDQHGQTIVHGPVGKDGKRGYLASARFDLAAGTTTEEVYFNDWFGSGRSRLRYDVTVASGSGRVQVGGWLRGVENGPPDGRVAMVARTQADDAGAALMGLRADGDAAPGYVLQPTVYLGKDGKVLSSADEALKALAPAATDLSATLPTDPLLTDPYADPTFKIPQ